MSTYFEFITINVCLITAGFGVGPHRKGRHSESSDPGGTGLDGPAGKRYEGRRKWSFLNDTQIISDNKPNTILNKSIQVL